MKWGQISKHYLEQLGFEKTGIQIPELGEPLLPSRWGQSRSYDHFVRAWHFCHPVHLTSAMPQQPVPACLSPRH